MKKLVFFVGATAVTAAALWLRRKKTPAVSPLSTELGVSLLVPPPAQEIHGPSPVGIPLEGDNGLDLVCSSMHLQEDGELISEFMPANHEDKGEVVGQEGGEEHVTPNDVLEDPDLQDDLDEDNDCNMDHLGVEAEEEENVGQGKEVRDVLHEEDGLVDTAEGADSMHDREKLLSELLETRDRIHNRLEETELAIFEKDRELMERKESLSQLRLTLEEKDDDISSLHSALRMERVKGERAKESTPTPKKLITRQGGDTTVDDQVEKIRRMLEAEHGNMTKLVNKLDATFLDAKKLVTKIDVDDTSRLKTDLEDASMDIGILKQKLSLCFKMMGSSVSSLKLTLDEEKWVSSFEQDIVTLIHRSFISEMQDRVVGENLPTMLLDKSCLDVMDDIVALRNELEAFVNQRDMQCRTEGSMELRTHRYPASRSVTSDEDNSEKNASIGVEKQLESGSEQDGELFENLRRTKSLSDKNPSGHSVAEIVKSHESIIWKRTREIIWRKGQPGEKGCSILRNDKNNDFANEIVPRIIGRLDGILKEKDKLVAVFDDYRRVHEIDEKFVKNDLSRFHTVKEDETLQSTPKQSKNKFCCHLTGNELHEEIRQLKQELEESVTETMILEEIYLALFKGSMGRLHLESIDHDLEAFISEDVNRLVFNKAIKKLSNENEASNVERLLMEDIYSLLFSEAVKDITNTVNSTRNLQMSFEGEGLPFDSNLSQSSEVDYLLNDNDLEALIKENICAVVFTEMIREWIIEIDTYNSERLISEDIHLTVFRELVKDTKNVLNSTSAGCQGKDLQCGNNLNQILEEDFRLTDYEVESQIRETTYMVLFSETAKEWKNEKDMYSIEKFLMDEIYCIIFTEVFKNIKDNANLALTRCLEKYLPVGSSLCEKSIISEKIGSLQKVDPLANHVDDEGVSDSSVSSESTETHSDLDLLRCEHKESTKQDDQHDRVLSMKDDVNFVSRNIEKDFQQTAFSQMQLEAGHLVTYTSAIMQDEHYCVSLPTRDEERQRDGFQAMLMPFRQFQEMLEDFDHKLCGKLGSNMSRLEDLNYQFNSVVEAAVSIKKKECLYRKAFTRRCYDLQTAEAEVDMLGDQVDRLLGFIEKLFTELDHHSLVFQNYSGITDILKLMQKELHKEAAFTSRQ